MAIKIVHASISENGNAGTDGKAKAGDQTGKEVCIRNWYDKKPWDMVLRYPDSTVAGAAANIAALLADSNLVGYDQTQRNTLYTKMQDCGMSVDKYIQSQRLSETDCSAFVTCSYVAAGVLKLAYTGNAPTTRTMESVYRNAGFNVLKDKKYLNSDTYLRKGDILLKVGSHTVICLESGAKAYGNVNDNYYPMYLGTSESFVDALKAVGESNTTLMHRRAIALKNGYPDGNYAGTAEQNAYLLSLLKSGKLIKA